MVACPLLSQGPHHWEALPEHFMELREDNSQPRISDLAKHSFKNEGKMKKKNLDKGQESLLSIVLY